MSTRNIVPRADGEGSIGTEEKHWEAGFFDKIKLKNLSVVNVKDFGAKGDGETDDTDAIQGALEYARKTINASNATDFHDVHNVIIFPSGTYRITKTLYVHRLCTLKSLGFVLINYDANTGTAIHFKPYQTGDIQIYHTKLLNAIGRPKNLLIDGTDGGFHIVNYPSTNTDTKNTTAITFGDTAEPTIDNASKFVIAQTGIDSVSIEHFTTGIILHNVHVYLLSFFRCHLENNDTHVLCGSVDDHPIDAGENITWLNCCFAHATCAFKYEATASMYNNFVSCSFDFNKTIIYKKFMSNSRIQLFFVNSHIEGATQSIVWHDVADSVSPSNYTIISITLVNCQLHHSYEDLFKGRFLDVKIIGCTWQHASNQAPLLYNNDILNINDASVVRTYMDSNAWLYMPPIIKNDNALSDGSFENIDTTQLPEIKDNEVHIEALFKDFTYFLLKGVKTYSITKDMPAEKNGITKALKITTIADNTANKIVTIKTKKLPTKPSENIRTRLFLYLPKSREFTSKELQIINIHMIYHFYDIDGNVVQIRENWEGNITEKEHLGEVPTNQWFTQNKTYSNINSPAGAFYYDIEYNTQLITDSTLYLGYIFANSVL